MPIFQLKYSTFPKKITNLKLHLRILLVSHVHQNNIHPCLAPFPQFFCSFAIKNNTKEIKDGSKIMKKECSKELHYFSLYYMSK